MASLIRQARRRAQPRLKVAIDWSNPITRGMTLAVLPIGGGFFDAVSGMRGAPTGSTPPALTNTTGQRGMLHPGGATTVSYSDFGALSKPSDMALSGGTIFAWGAQAGLGGIAERNDNNTVNAGWSVGIDGGGFLNFLAEHSSVNYLKRTTSAVPTTPTSVAITVLGNPMSDSDTVFYVGGQQAATVLNAGGSGSTGSDLANTLYVGRASFNSSGSTFAGSFNGTLELVLMWNRQLSAAEIASLHANRYQIFRQTSRRIITYLPPTNVTVALTGNAATGAVGTLAPTHTVKIGAGDAATGAVGNITTPITVALTSVHATAAVSKATPAHTVALTGNSAAGAVGSVTSASALTITGVATSGAIGTLASSTTVALSGNNSAGNVGVVSPAVGAAITGAGSVGAVGTVLAGDANVTLALSGVTATGFAGNILYGLPPVLAEQTPTFIITSALTVDVSTPVNNVETSVSL